jgi:hypothetical protein
MTSLPSHLAARRETPGPVDGLRFVLSDGSFDHGKMEAVARTRAVTFARVYDDDLERAYRAELQTLAADADGERQIWLMREIAAGRLPGIAITGHAAREMASDGFLVDPLKQVMTSRDRAV